MKKKGIVVLAVLLALAIGGGAWYLSIQADREIGSILGNARNQEALGGDIPQLLEKHKDSRRFEQAVIAELDTCTPEEMGRLLSALGNSGYENANVKAAFPEKAKGHLSQENPKSYLQTLATFSRYAGGYYYTMEDLVAETALVALLEDRGEGVIFQNGQGGYYDTQEKEKNAYYSNELLDQIEERHTYYGDLYTFQYDKMRHRPTGEDWEDELMQKYDEHDFTAYHKGQPLDVGALKEDFRRYMAGAKAVYLCGDVLAIYKNGKVYTTEGEILFARELTWEEQVENATNAVCEAWCAYTDEGYDAIAFFNENKEKFPLLTTEEVEALMPGAWRMYYTHENEYGYVFDKTGTYWRDTNPDKVYQWVAEDGVLYREKLKHNGQWYQSHTVRKVTEDVYIFFTAPDDDFYYAMKKISQ